MHHRIPRAHRPPWHSLLGEVHAALAEGIEPEQLLELLEHEAAARSSEERRHLPIPLV